MNIRHITSQLVDDKEVNEREREGEYIQQTRSSLLRAVVVTNTLFFVRRTVNYIIRFLFMSLFLLLSLRWAKMTTTTTTTTNSKRLSSTLTERFLHMHSPISETRSISFRRRDRDDIKLTMLEMFFFFFFSSVYFYLLTWSKIGLEMH